MLPHVLDRQALGGRQGVVRADAEKVCWGHMVKGFESMPGSGLSVREVVRPGYVLASCGTVENGQA